MTIDEAIKNREDCLKYLEEIGPKASHDCLEAVRWSVKALKALRSVSREQAEKVWRGEWNQDERGRVVCNRCGSMAAIGTENALHNAKKYDRFCFYCGAPMTDEAVEMVMERLEALENDN